MDPKKFEHFEVESTEQLRQWLLENHSQSESVWLVTYKKAVPHKYVSRRDVLDELVCFGWIDGRRQKVDSEKTMQLISPRRAHHWARSYKERAQRLIEEGRMHPAGLRAIALSRENGLWDFMDDVDDLVIPEDLSKKLAAEDDARVFFESINDSSKRFVLRWIKLSKTDKTRSRRIDKIVELSSRGEKLPGS